MSWRTSQFQRLLPTRIPQQFSSSWRLFSASDGRQAIAQEWCSTWIRKFQKLFPPWLGFGSPSPFQPSQSSSLPGFLPLQELPVIGDLHVQLDFDVHEILILLLVGGHFLSQPRHFLILLGELRDVTVLGLIQISLQVTGPSVQCVSLLFSLRYKYPQYE